MNTHLKVIVYYLLFFIFLPGLKAQNLNVTQSKPEYNFTSTSLQKIIGYDSSYFYALKYEANRYYVEKLDKNLNFVKKEPLKLNEGFKQYHLEDMVHFHGELYVFLTKYQLKDITLYYRKIDKDSLLPSTDYIEINTIKNVKGNWADFHFSLSRKESKLLIASRIKLNWSKAQFNEYYVFGDGLELLWKRKDSFEFTGLGPRNDQYTVDDYGNVTILSLIKRENIFSLGKPVRNAYSISRYTDDGENYRNYPISLLNKYIRGIKTIADDNGGLICAGLYSDIFKSGVKGTFFFRIDDKKGTIYDNRLNAFQPDFLSRLSASNEPIIGGGEELVDYELNDLILRENNNIILISEQFFNQTYDTYNNIIVTCFDENGEVYWNRVIQKQQSFDINTIDKTTVDPVDYRDYIRDTGILFPYNPNYCSYSLMAPINKNYIVIFYNDNLKNIGEPEKIKGLGRMKKSYLAAITIDSYGNMKKEVLFRWQKKALYSIPLRYYDTKYNKIIIPAYRGKKYNYYKITAGS